MVVALAAGRRDEHRVRPEPGTTGADHARTQPWHRREDRRGGGGSSLPPTVLLAFFYGQSRIFFVMIARRPAAARPVKGRQTANAGGDHPCSPAIVTSALAGVARLDEIAALANAGTLVAFIAVATCLLVLRKARSGPPARCSARRWRGSGRWRSPCASPVLQPADAQLWCLLGTRSALPIRAPAVRAGATPEPGYAPLRRWGPTASGKSAS